MTRSMAARLVHTAVNSSGLFPVLARLRSLSSTLHTLLLILTIALLITILIHQIDLTHLVRDLLTSFGRFLQKLSPQRRFKTLDVAAKDFDVAST